MSNPAVLITGIDLVTALGVGREATWAALCAGRSGTRPITKFDATGFATRFANEVPAAELATALAACWPGDTSRVGLCAQMLKVAIEGALHDAGLERSELGPRLGIVVGTSGGGSALPDDDRTAHFLAPPPYNDHSIWPALEGYGPGPRFAVAAACASGAHVALGYDLIQAGQLDAAIVAGVEASISPFNIASFNSMLALSMRNDEPARASRPFDRRRDGFVMGDGAGVVILEREALARRRGATVYAELLGYGATSEAASMAVPLEGGRGMARAMAQALARAGLDAGQIDYISAHGTSTPANDVCETEGIKRVFGAHAKRLALSSQKSMIGHTTGAAGTIELAITAMTVRHGVITPTINYEEPDPACDLDYTPNTALERPVRYALSNSFAFGGHNCTLALGRYDHDQRL